MAQLRPPLQPLQPLQPLHAQPVVICWSRILKRLLLSQPAEAAAAGAVLVSRTSQPAGTSGIAGVLLRSHVGESGEFLQSCSPCEQPPAFTVKSSSWTSAVSQTGPGTLRFQLITHTRIRWLRGSEQPMHHRTSDHNNGAIRLQLCFHNQPYANDAGCHSRAFLSVIDEQPPFT